MRILSKEDLSVVKEAGCCFSLCVCVCVHTHVRVCMLDNTSYCLDWSAHSVFPWLYTAMSLPQYFPVLLIYFNYL